MIGSKNHQWLDSSLNQNVKSSFNGLVWFGLGLSFLNQFELGLGLLKLVKLKLVIDLVKA